MFNFGNRPAGQAVSATPSKFAPPGRGESAKKESDEASVVQIQQTGADWDSQMDSLDKAQEQLLNDQWKLLRTQIGSLMSALAEMRSEMNDLKDNVLTKEVEQVINNLLGSHEDHGEKHAGLLERVAYLETFVGESADRHAKEISDAHGNHSDHKATMETRLEYLESLVGDTADKHAKELEGAVGRLQDLHAAVQECAQKEHHASMEERVNFIEKYIGESVDNHDSHKTTMETRLEYIESMIGDNADKHATEILEAKGSLEGAIKLCAQHDHASGLEKRMEYMEKTLGEGADMHEGHMAHRTTMETRLEYLEGLLGDGADKHAAALSRVGSLEAAIQACAKHDHATSLDGRVGYLENCVGESADHHDTHKVNMEGRLEFLESMIGDSAEKHGKEIENAHDKLKDLHAAISSCAKSEHHNSLEARMEYLESLLGDSADKHDKVSKELEAAHAKVRDLGSKFNGDGALWDQRHETLDQRMDALERQHGDASDNHGRKMSTLEAGHMKLKNSHDELTGVLRGETASRDILLDERFQGVENFLLQTGEKQVKELEDTKLKLRETQSKVETQRGTLDSLRSMMDQRLAAIDDHLAENAGKKFADFTQDLEKRLFYMQEDQKRARDVLESSLQEQIRLEHSLHDESNRQSKDHWDREMKARMSYQDQYKDLIQQERTGRETIEQMLGERMQHLERVLSNETNRIWVAIDKHTHEGLEKPEPVYEVMEPQFQVLPPVVEMMAPVFGGTLPPQMMGGPMSPGASSRMDRMSIGGVSIGTQSIRSHVPSNGHMSPGHSTGHTSPRVGPPTISHPATGSTRGGSHGSTVGTPARLQERSRAGHK